MQDLKTAVQRIFREVLNLPELELSETTTALEVPGWDSLAHVTLIASVEEEFGVRFALSDIRKMKNVGDLLTILARKRRGQ